MTTYDITVTVTCHWVGTRETEMDAHEAALAGMRRRYPDLMWMVTQVEVLEP